MNILIATGVYPPESGGPATYSKFLNDNLPKEGFGVEVLPFSMVRKHAKGISHFVYFIELLKRGGKADLIYAQDPVSVGLPAFLAARLLQKKFVLRLGGDYAWEQGTLRYSVTDSLDEFSKGYKEYPFFVRVLKSIQYFVASQTKTIVVPSQYLKKIVMNWGIKEENIAVVYNAFLAPVVEKTKEELRKELKLDGNIILSAGRLVPWKGFAELIETMPDILKENKDAKLYIIGDGPEQKILEEKIKNQQLENAVIMLGALPHEKILEYMKVADVFALNTFYEGMSHMLLESMALGIPITTTRIGGNKELIIDKQNGILFEHNNKEEIKSTINMVLNDRSKAREYAQNAQKTLERFKRSDVLDKTAEILQSI